MFDESFASRPRQVVEVGRVPVGVLEIEQRPEELYLAVIELVAGWLGRGLGAEIVRSLITHAQISGRPLGLHVLRVNSRAITFYERQGLAIVEVEAHKLRLQTP